jgi:hypothetical protein
MRRLRPQTLDTNATTSAAAEGVKPKSLQKPELPKKSKPLENPRETRTLQLEIGMRRPRPQTLDTNATTSASPDGVPETSKILTGNS